MSPDSARRDGSDPSAIPLGGIGGATTRPDSRTNMVVVITGMSGAGKTMALKAFEDMGYEAVDNLPLVLLGGLVGGGNEMKRPIAIGIDIRTRDFDVARLLSLLDTVGAERDLDVELLFLDADDEVLRRRFTESRRRHPIGGDLPITDGVALERRMLLELRDRADLVVDTTRLPAGELKHILETRYAHAASPGMHVFVTSFGFRHGLPREADLVFDVRFLRNPHYVPELEPLTGQDEQVGAYVADDADFGRFYESLKGLLDPLLPRYEVEGKSYLTIAIGCTGGKHRSVYVAERLASWLASQGRHVTVRHRDMPGGGTTAAIEGDAQREEPGGGR